MKSHEILKKKEYYL